MKNKKLFALYSSSWLLMLALSSILIISCKKENDLGAMPPVITKITSTLDNNTSLTRATLSDWIQIKGQHLGTTKVVKFSTIEVMKGDFFANDTSVTVRIPAELPNPVDNPVTVVTDYGEATFNFSIVQPPPGITGFDPLSGGAGDIVTITGTYFNNLVDVKFDSVVAEVVSSTQTEIKVKVPEGIIQSFVYVTTTGGTTKSANAFGFKYIVYDDARNAAWWEGSWSSVNDFANTTIVKRGTNAIRQEYTGGYGGFQVGNGGSQILLADFQAVKLSIYGGPGTSGKKVKVVLNGVYAAGKELFLEEGKWTDFTIPLSELGSPTDLQTIVIQEFSDNKSVIYIDDLGLI